MDPTTRWMLIAGGAAALVALVAYLADLLRMRRSDLDRVGFMPWTTIFFWSMMLAVLLLGGGGTIWLKG